MRMASEEPKDQFKAAAKIISIIFHPLLMPVYGMAIIFSAPTLFGYLPANVKKLLILIMLINNVLLPLSFLPFFIHRNIISSWTITERKERNIPLIIITVLYGITSYLIFRFPIPVFLKTYVLAAFIMSLIVTVINFWWKISLHAVGAGALISLVFILSLKMLTPLEWYLISTVIIGGLVLSSRLKLNFHSPQQVWIGLFTGFFGLAFFMILFQQLI
jgi:hypothetical protein